jgi:predicted transcriptional regulator
VSAEAARYRRSESARFRRFGHVPGKPQIDDLPLPLRLQKPAAQQGDGLVLEARLRIRQIDRLQQGVSRESRFSRESRSWHSNVDIQMVTLYACVMKRTTLILEDACIEGVRELAQKEHREMSRVVNELLAEGLQRRAQVRRGTFQLPAFRMGQARVNLGDRDALEAAMEQ